MDFNTLLEEAHIAAAEVDAHMTEDQRERFMERFMAKHSAPFNTIPLHRDLIEHEIVRSGVSPHASFSAIFHYPDGSRVFDGKTWTALPFNDASKVTHTYTPG